MTVGEHGRTESVPRRRRASRRDAKNFSGERRDVLREVRVRGIASGRVQKAVGPELQSAAVVNRRCRNAVEQNGALTEASGHFTIAFDPVDGASA